MTEVLNSSSGRSNTSENKVAQFMTSGSFDSGFSLQLMAKDVGLAIGLARALDRPVEVADHVADQWRRIAGQVSPGHRPHAAVHPAGRGAAGLSGG